MFISWQTCLLLFVMVFSLVRQVVLMALERRQRNLEGSGRRWGSVMEVPRDALLTRLLVREREGRARFNTLCL